MTVMRLKGLEGSNTGGDEAGTMLYSKQQRSISVTFSQTVISPAVCGAEAVPYRPRHQEEALK